jgi:23S rRNA (guanosine2251-2'-O)-methyltransferase
LKNYSYGIHSVKALLAGHEAKIECLYKQADRQDKRLEEVLQLAKAHRVPVKAVSSDELVQLTGEKNHQGIVAVCATQRQYQEDDLWDLLEQTKQPLLLILDGVTDPHNLGACLRTADAAGVTAVIAPKDRAVGLTPAARKVASGAAETVPFIQVTNLARVMKQLRDRGVWIYGTDDTATQSLYDCKLSGAMAFVMGAEGEGMRRLTREHCDFLVQIPMVGTVSSLNVSVAAGVCLYEAVRQRAS